MRCPKCHYISFDYLETCKKCGADLRQLKEKFRVYGGGGEQFSLWEWLMSEEESPGASSVAHETEPEGEEITIDLGSEEGIDLTLEEIPEGEDEEEIARESQEADEVISLEEINLDTDIIVEDESPSSETSEISDEKEGIEVTADELIPSDIDFSDEEIVEELKNIEAELSSEQELSETDATQDLKLDDVDEEVDDVLKGLEAVLAEDDVSESEAKPQDEDILEIEELEVEAQEISSELNEPQEIITDIELDDEENKELLKQLELTLSEKEGDKKKSEK